MEKVLMSPQNFKRVCDLTENQIPNIPGIYAIRISDVHDIAEPFCSELLNRGHNLLYIGIASKSLRKRFWQEELNHQRPATFFRSLGAILGYRPIKGSLMGRKNTKNYKFCPNDTEKIRQWMQEHLIVNFITTSDHLKDLEERLICSYKPIINIQKNPYKMEEVSKLRSECVYIANSVE